jgi:hypothetical protein
MNFSSLPSGFRILDAIGFQETMQGRIGNLYAKASGKDLLKMGEVTIGKLPSVNLDNLPTILEFLR